MEDFAVLCQNSSIMLEQMAEQYRQNGTISLTTPSHLKCPLALLVNTLSKVIVIFDRQCERFTKVKMIGATKAFLQELKKCDPC
jgi:hypothetical protein